MVDVITINVVEDMEEIKIEEEEEEEEEDSEAEGIIKNIKIINKQRIARYVLGIQVH